MREALKLVWTPGLRQEKLLRVIARLYVHVNVHPNLRPPHVYLNVTSSSFKPFMCKKKRKDQP